MTDSYNAIVPKVFTALAQQLGVEVQQGRIDIPAHLGVGYCVGYDVNENIRILRTNYKLNQAIQLDNPEVLSSNKILLFKFQGVLNEGVVEDERKEIPRVLIATSRINVENTIRMDEDHSINIEIDADYLKQQLGTAEHAPSIKALLENNQPLLFEQLLYADLNQLLKEMVDASSYGAFELFYLKIKAEQIICHLLSVLEQRKEQTVYPLNGQDVQAIYQMRNTILADLTQPPVLAALVAQSNMSLSKLQRLFKQVFGSTVFQYYQTFRIREAARLLREEQQSVSEVGYQLGFTNLSHFSKVFEQQLGVTPKKYTRL